MLRIFYKLESLQWYLFLFRKSAFLNRTNRVSNLGNISVVFYAKTGKIEPKEKAKLWCHRVTRCPLKDSESHIQKDAELDSETQGHVYWGLRKKTRGQGRRGFVGCCEDKDNKIELGTGW